MEFAVEDHVFLRVTTTTGVGRVICARRLKKYVPNPSHVLEVEDVQVREDLSVEVQPVRIMESQTEQLKGKTISLVKVVWDSRKGDSTWELEGVMREYYPHLFSGSGELRSENIV
ncbi:uncharacterized protein LOC106766055 [Vigna radiata var. radiata]|uniref:Uncharacterized protein LOC106766055 n=1 Tax=Vigna radiata var. radiata TaxID=3916 RepID=A0A1S3UJU2_VIGRR|nr:uncharacterized protein LOC106766055 [Vigna radiata var. radiata]